MATTQSKVSKKNQQKLELETSTKNKWITRLQWILFALAFIIYSNSLSNGYNMDDYLVTKNHRYTSQGLNSETVKNIFTSPYYSDDSGYSYGYRPIVHLSFALEHEIFGESPQAGHFINMLLFAFSVFFLFKFLNLLFGEKNYLYSFLACALFAIHPIHTEVVNSLKNRDEILSFFFTILAGIQVIRHTEKKKISQFILAVLFFFLAILSKKSVYPMVVIIPAAIYLIKEVSFIRLLILTAIMSIPAAVFGSEMQIGRMILMGVFPITALLTVYFLKNWKEYYEKYHLKEVLLLGLPTLLIILLIRYSTQNWNLYFLLLIIPPAFFLLRTNMKVAIWIITLCTLYIAVRFDSKELYTIHLALITSFTLHSYFIQKEKNIPIIILTFICIIISFIYGGIFPLSYLTINLIGFYWLLSKKNKISTLIYSIFTILALLIIPLIRKNDDAFMNSVSIYAYILLTFLLLFFVFKKLSEQKMIQWGFISILFIGFSVLSLNSYIENLKNPQQQVAIEDNNQQPEIDPITLAHKQKETTPNMSKNIFQEGRDLEYVENPLVAIHSQSEKIGTGFYTLGHYARLMLFPQKLSYYYGYAEIETQNMKSPWVWVSIIFHLGIISLMLIYFKRNWMITVGFAWYLACILLFSNWVELVAGIVGERLAYLASAGFLIGIAGIAQELKLFERKKETYIIPLATIGILLSGRTWVRNYDWDSEYKLMKHDIKHLNMSAQAHNLYASVLMRIGSEDTALTEDQKMIFFTSGNKHYKRATEIDSLFFNATFDWGRSAMYIHDTSTAMKAFERCTRLAPTFEDAKIKLSYLKLFYSHYQGPDKMDYQIYWDSLQNAQRQSQIQQ